jgi:hypothetical protein
MAVYFLDLVNEFIYIRCKQEVFFKVMRMSAYPSEHTFCHFILQLKMVESSTPYIEILIFLRKKQPQPPVV